MDETRPTVENEPALRYNSATINEEAGEQEHQREPIVYDGDCTVCRTLKSEAERRLDNDKVRFEVFQTAELERLPPGLTRELAEQEMVLILKDGRQVSGAGAFVAVMRQTDGFWGTVNRLLHPASPLLGPFYRLFAHHRHRSARWLERQGNDEK